MFHRIRILNYLFEDYTKKYPLSKKKINDCVDGLYEYIKTCEFINNQKENKEMLEKEEQHKILIENELLNFLLTHKLLEVKEGCGKRKRYSVEEVRELLGNKLLTKYFSISLKVLTYHLTNQYKDKVKDKYKIYLMNKKYEGKEKEVNQIKIIDFIYYNL